MKNLTWEIDRCWIILQIMNVIFGRLDLQGSVTTRNWWQLKNFLFSPSLGKWSNLTNIFSDGLVQPPTRLVCHFFLLALQAWHGPFAPSRGPGLCDLVHQDDIAHPFGNPPATPTMKGIPFFCLLVKVWLGCVPKVWWNTLRITFCLFRQLFLGILPW